MMAVTAHAPSIAFHLVVLLTEKSLRPLGICVLFLRDPQAGWKLRREMISSGGQPVARRWAGQAGVPAPSLLDQTHVIDAPIRFPAHRRPRESNQSTRRGRVRLHAPVLSVGRAQRLRGPERA